MIPEDCGHDSWKVYAAPRPPVSETRSEIDISSAVTAGGRERAGTPRERGRRARRVGRGGEGGERGRARHGRQECLREAAAADRAAVRPVSPLPFGRRRRRHQVIVGPPFGPLPDERQQHLLGDRVLDGVADGWRQSGGGGGQRAAAARWTARLTSSPGGRYNRGD